VEVGVDGREAAPLIHAFDQQAYRVIVPMRVRALDRVGGRPVGAELGKFDFVWTKNSPYRIGTGKRGEGT
jgi:hypothetical protein